MTIFRVFSLTVALLFASVLRAQETILFGDVPIPKDLEIIETPELPIAGIWTGRWNNSRNHILIVEGYENEEILSLIYAVGRDRNGLANWFRSTAILENGTLKLTDEQFPARYELSDSGRMRGYHPNGDSFAILERQTPSEFLSAPAKDWFSIGERGFLATDIIEDGKPINLAVAVYIPKGDGPFPLAMIHHGSTGSGKNPHDFDWFFENDWLADLLNAHGWIVAFPQRRGRGGSDGLYDEGFAEDRAQGYSQEPALSIPGAERALIDVNAALAALQKRPDVNTDKPLLGGMSRGGVVALLQAGSSPDNFAGVINFVGGWVNETDGDPVINPTLFRRIGSFAGPVLSIYADNDPLYSIEHSKSNLAEMSANGADSQLYVVTAPRHLAGHWVLYWPPLWENVVTDFLEQIE